MWTQSCALRKVVELGMRGSRSDDQISRKRVLESVKRHPLALSRASLVAGPSFVCVKLVFSEA